MKIKNIEVKEDGGRESTKLLEVFFVVVYICTLARVCKEKLPDVSLCKYNHWKQPLMVCNNTVAYPATFT